MTAVEWLISQKMPLTSEEFDDIIQQALEMEKQQAEKMYNDVQVFTEELKDKIDSFEYSVNQNSYISDYVKEWFQQFKKK